MPTFYVVNVILYIINVTCFTSQCDTKLRYNQLIYNALLICSIRLFFVILQL